MKKNSQTLLAVTSGLLIAFSYIPFYAILGLVALVPLWVGLDRAKTYKEAFKLSWISQFLLSIIGFHWIAHTAHDFGYMPWWLSIIVLIAFAGIVHIHFCFASLMYMYINKRANFVGVKSDFLKVICFFFAETFSPMLFPWNFGYTWMTSAFPIKHTAELYGFIGLSFLSLLANVAFKGVYQARLANNKKLATNFIMSFIVGFSCLNIIGYTLLKSVPDFDKKWKVGVVQANIGNFEKVQAEHGGRFQLKIIEKYLELSEKLVKENPEVDFLVWPETAIPISISDWNKHSFLYRKLFYGLEKINKPLLSGSFQSNKRTFNSAVLINEKAELIDSYKKSLLLAWGETVPGTDDYPELQDKLKNILPALSFFGKGTGPKIMELNGTKLGLNICYEGIHPDFMWGLKKLGVNLLVNLTNDSWFGSTFEPYQHMYMTLARSIELRLPIVRSTNTGITTVMDAKGNIGKFSPMNEEWIHVYDLEGHELPPGTLYQKLGSFTPWLLMFLLGIPLLRERFSSAKNKAS